MSIRVEDPAQSLMSSDVQVGGTRNAWRTARTPPSGPPHWRPRRLSGRPSGRPAPSWAARRAPRSIRPAGQRGGGLLICGEPHEPEPRDQASTAQNTYSPPSEPQSMISVSPGVHTARAAAPVMPGPPRRLQRSDQAAEVPRRPSVPGRSRGRQQPLGRDPPLRPAPPLSDRRPDLIVVVTAVPARRRPAASVVPLHDSLDRLVSCRRSPRHPGSCPPPGRRPECPSVPSRSSQQAPVR
jgi:hypothetical protein